MNGLVVNPTAIKEAEYALMDSGITEDELIARASSGLVARIKELASVNDKIVVAVGSGNNGCDGLDTALTLYSQGYKVAVLLASKYANEGNIKRRNAIIKERIPLVKAFDGAEKYIIDAIFGTGIRRDPDSDTAQIINEINRHGAYKISVDLPSGLCGESGRAYFPTVKANETVTFSYIKSGMILGEGRNFCGKVSVFDIGIKCDAVGKILSAQDVKIEERLPETHKGVYGKTVIIGGCETLPGAPLMAFESAVSASRSGAGLVTLCVPRSLKCAYQARVKETMLRFMPDDGKNMLFDRNELNDIIKKYNTIVIGPGMGNNDETKMIVTYLAMNFYGTLVVDADGINAIAPHLKTIKHHTCSLVFTPHTVEFIRLCPKCGEGNYLENIKNFALDNKCIVAVKSATTVVTDGSTLYFNTTGTPAMAKGGSGDVLSGMVGAFACVLPPLKAVATAVYHFGKAGERAKARLNSVTSVLASDIIVEICDAP